MLNADMAMCAHYLFVYVHTVIQMFGEINNTFIQKGHIELIKTESKHIYKVTKYYK